MIRSDKWNPFCGSYPNSKRMFRVSEEALGRFLKRMLSPASDKQRKLRTIDLLKTLGLPVFKEMVREELKDIRESGDTDVAAKAVEIEARS